LDPDQVEFCLVATARRIKMVKLAGKYSFVSQENFDDYLKAAGVYLFSFLFVVSYAESRLSQGNLNQPDVAFLLYVGSYTLAIK
jgi:hypothetical protein